MTNQKSPMGLDNSSKNTDEQSSDPELIKTPTISLPKGGDSIRGIGEKFAANPLLALAP